MKIVLSGVETKNKGAELMLYSILQEIERRFPDSKVYIPYNRIKQGLGYIKTSLDLKYTPYSYFVFKSHIQGLFRRLKLPSDWLYSFNFVKGADWFLDGSGFAFSDQWDISNQRLRMWEVMLSKLYKQGCKIVFLPQAFGPVEKPNTKRALNIISNYASVIMPREKVSYNYLIQSGVVNMYKVKLFSDFTSLVEGRFPKKYEHLRDGICVIPNLRMIDRGKISFDNYIHLLSAIITEGKDSNRPVYLLNHEGPKDADLCMKCKETIGGDIEIVTNLNALEVKGLIASAYIVVTSRFHGLASALNCCVPCLATSWSHKYEELYKDYGLDSYVLPLDNIEGAVSQVRELLAEQENKRIRLHLNRMIPQIMVQTREMWNYIWNL
ncbi:MAG: polysaccharide pyruvyl transferase family protein [Bacteroidaceae bacterium]|nr:polysaccharide pyruvyl transferase family protein [Bacteroidaceae bacterium]